METFKLYPILGRKVDVPQGDASLLQAAGAGAAMTHDVGGINFSLERKRNTCSKSYGYTKATTDATSQHTKCLGMFELYDGTNRNHVYADNGKIYVISNTLAMTAVDASSPVALATANNALYSMIQVGDYIAITDNATTASYKWKHGDANLTTLIASGTAYKFKYLMPFQRRVVGGYSDQTDGDIEIRWSTSWPGTAITSLNFPAGNQLYIPNGDPVSGLALMGRDKAYVYCQNSIHELVYLADYVLPFKLYTQNAAHGAVNHHSIVTAAGSHYLFNAEYGFVKYDGGRDFTAIISDDIESDVAGITPAYYDLIVGAYIPSLRQIVWTVPSAGSTTPNRLFFYSPQSGRWTIEDKAARFVTNWRMASQMTWTGFIAAIGGGAAVWTSAPSPETWAMYAASGAGLAFGNTDGFAYLYGTDNTTTSYRIEPILDFGNAQSQKILQEIWFELAKVGNYSITVWHRGGDTVGEVEGKAWESLGTISCDSPTNPCLRNFSRTHRLHQLKWGTSAANEAYCVSAIVLRYLKEGTY